MGYGKATIFKDRGKWRGQVKYKDETGKWRNKSKTFTAKGKREAQRQADEWREQLQQEAAAASGARYAGETVLGYVGRYIEGKATYIEPSTSKEYRRLLKNQLSKLGEIELDELTPDIVEAWVKDLSETHVPGTVKKALSLLRSAMKQAVERDRLQKDPTRGVHPPKAQKQKPNALDERERGKVLNVLAAFNELTPFAIAVKMSMFTGMRQGEICALRWREADLNAGTIRITLTIGTEEGGRYYLKDPKTAGSMRTIRIPGELAHDLSKRRGQMEARCLAAGISFREDFFVIGDIDGEFMKPHVLSIRWRKLADSLELVGTQGRRPTFHDLRHTYATTGVAAGIDIKTVSNALGHSNTAMTLNTYASEDPDAQRRAADTIGKAYEAAREAARPRIIPLAGTA